MIIIIIDKPETPFNTSLPVTQTENHDSNILKFRKTL